MAKIGEKELKQQLKAGDFSRAYLIYGEEEYLKEYYVDQLKKKNVDEAFEDFNFHSFNGKDATLSDILSDAEMLPMMGSCNFVLVCDYPIDKSQKEMNELKEFLADIPETTMLVFLYKSLPFNTKDNSKLKAIEAAFTNAGTTVVFDRRTQSELIKMIVNGCKRRNALISADNAAYLISVSGNDIKTLMNEAEKLSAFASGGEITKSIINQLAVKCLQARVYDLSKAVIKGEYDKAYSVLDTLFIMKEEPVNILAAISNCYVDMYRVKCAKISGMPAEDVGNYYNYKGRDFVLRNAARDCFELSINQLRRSLDVIMEADNNLKSTATDKKLILEETMVKLLLISKEVSYD